MAMFFAFLRIFACASLMLFWVGGRASDSVEFKPGALLLKLDGLTLAGVKDTEILFDEMGIKGRVICGAVVGRQYSKCEGGLAAVGGDLSVSARSGDANSDRGFVVSINIDGINSKISPEQLVLVFLKGWRMESIFDRLAEKESSPFARNVCNSVFKKWNSGGVHMRVLLGCEREGQERFVKSLRVSVEDVPSFSF